MQIQVQSTKRGRRIDVQIQEGYDPLLWKVGGGLMLGVVVVVAVLLSARWGEEVSQYERQAQICRQNYSINCKNRKGAIEQCRKWMMCYSLQAELQVKLVQTLASMLGNALGSMDGCLLLSSLSVSCLIIYCLVRSQKAYHLKIAYHP